MEDREKYQFPYELQFEGVHDFPDDRDYEWHDRLKWHFNDQCDADSEGHCANGVKIYDVYAWTAPSGHTDLNGEERERIKIAEINLTTKLYTSLTGDERLFFQHRLVYNDHTLWPDRWRFPQNNDVEFKGERDTPVFPKIDGLTPEDDEWPWPDSDEDAEAKYLSLTRTGKGCPFRFLFY